MSAIIMRSAIIHWGGSPPPELAYILSDGHTRRVVTWAEVMEERRKRQAEILYRKRHVEPWRAYKLWVAYFDQPLMGGWHAFLEDHRGAGYRIWIDRDRPHLREHLVQIFPLVLPLGSSWDRHWPAWEQWKVAFAKAFQRRRHDREPLGVAYIWWNQHDAPRRSPAGETVGAGPTHQPSHFLPEKDRP